MSSPPRSEPAMRLRSLAELAPRELTWLWPGRLALNKLAIFQGDPGLAKSVVALELCARLSTGRPFPDGSPGPGPASAIILTGEDDPEDTVRPRLHHFGADPGRVFVLDALGEDGEEPVRFPDQAGLLDRALARTGARLVVIDPITDFLHPSVNVNSEASVRRALAPLRQLARKHGCVPLMVCNLNKKGGSRAVYRGLNSIAFLAVCRSGWLFAPDPRQPEHTVLAEIKNNLGPPQPSLAYAVSRERGSPPNLTWLGPTEYSANDLLAGTAHAIRLPAPREQARAFLEAALEDGPRTSRDLWALAQEQGLSERTLHRARKEVGARSVRAWVEGKFQSYWLLPGQQLPSAAPAESAPPAEETDLEPWLAPLREQFPPLTPLDEI